MAEKCSDVKDGSNATTDQSGIGPSPREEQHSDERLPTYEDNETDANGNIPKENSGNLAESGVASQSSSSAANPPPYTAAANSSKLIAVPQISDQPTAPFLTAYPSILIRYGITLEYWTRFVERTFTCLFATASQHASQHATDVGNSIKGFHKDSAAITKTSLRGIGDSAKRLNPFGVIGGTVGLAVHATGYIVGSVFNAPLSAMQAPQTRKQRTLAYLTEVNKNEFQARGLEAMLLDTEELAVRLGTTVNVIVEAARLKEEEGIASQMATLQQWLEKVTVDEARAGAEMVASSSSAPQRPRTRLQLSPGTLWLVLVRKTDTDE